MKKVKNCLDCAFCVRKRDYWHSIILAPERSKWIYKTDFLTIEERNKARKVDFNFIGEDKRSFDNWHVIFEKKEEEVKSEKRRQFPFALNSVEWEPLGGKDYEKLAEQYGLEPPPDNPPEYDYLSCFLEQWDENANPELMNRRKDLSNYKYCSSNVKTLHYMDIGNKTLEACKKESDLRSEKKSFRLNIVWGIILVIFGFILGKIPVNFNSDNSKNVNEFKNQKVIQSTTTLKGVSK